MACAFSLVNVTLSAGVGYHAKLTDTPLNFNSNHVRSKQDLNEQKVYALTEDIKKKTWKKEEVAQWIHSREWHNLLS